MSDALRTGDEPARLPERDGQDGLEAYTDGGNHD